MDLEKAKEIIRKLPVDTKHCQVVFREGNENSISDWTLGRK